MKRLISPRGFTLIELLVAISVLALMADLSWRGVDGMSRAQASLRQYSDDTLALQAGLAQWQTDLDALAWLPDMTGLDWDGRALRILRRDTVSPGDGLLVVAWARRNSVVGSQWLRWQSPPLRTQGELRLAWQKAALWAQNPSEEDRKLEVAIAPIDQWQIFYYRSDAWSNPLSSEGAAPDPQAASIAPVPDGIRLVLSLTPGQSISGTLTRDWVRPDVGGGK